MRRGFALPIILLLIVALISIIAGWYFLYGREWFLDRQLRRAFSQNDGLYNPLNPPLQSPKDETANWKTYTNIEWSFSFKYPEKLTITNKSLEGEALPPVTVVEVWSAPTELRPKEVFLYRINVSVFDNPNYLSVSEWIERDQPEEVIKSFKREKMEVGGIIGEKVIIPLSLEGSMHVLIGKEGKIYQFLFQPYDEDQPYNNQDEFTNIFYGILSTFKFLD